MTGTKKPDPLGGPGSYKCPSSIGKAVNSNWRTASSIKFDATPLPNPDMGTLSPGPAYNIMSQFREGEAPAIGMPKGERNVLKPDTNPEVRYRYEGLTSFVDRDFKKVSIGTAPKLVIPKSIFDRAPGCVYNQQVIDFRSGPGGNDFGRVTGRDAPICNIFSH